MSVNLFFVLVLGLLLAMFSYFKPSHSKNADNTDMPRLVLENFIIYEVTCDGVAHFFEGKEGKRFDERYEVTSGKFSNNTKSLFESIRADNALYQDNRIELNGNVHYMREDGLEFRSQEGTYDENKSLIRTQGDFTLTQNNNRVDGTRLYYNTMLDTVSADEVRGSYQLH